MCVLHWFLKYPHLSRVVSCLCLWRIQSLKGTKWVLNPFQKPIYYKQELTQGLQLCVISVQSLSRVRLFVTPLTAAHQASLFHHQLPEFTQTHVHWVGDATNHLILCRSCSSCLQSFPASESFKISQFFASCGQSIGVSASFLPMNVQDWSFRMDCLDLLAVQGTLKSLLQHHSSKASILLTFLYSLTLTSIHNYWKNHSLD